MLEMREEKKKEKEAGRSSSSRTPPRQPPQPSTSSSASGSPSSPPPCSCHCHHSHHHSIPVRPDDDNDSPDSPLSVRQQLSFRRRMGVWLRGSPLVASVCAFALIYYFYRRQDLPPPQPSRLPTDLCDPFAEPGFLHYDTAHPKSARWIPFAEECDPAPDWIALFEARDVDALSFLANRTILVLGDSVDRNGLEHLAVMLGLPRYPVPYDDASKKGVVPAGWDERGIPWVVEVPWLDTTFTNGFMYGLDDEDNFRQQPDWHPPGMAEERVDKLFKVHTDQLKYPPSFISIHSGLWDLAFFGRQDRVSKLSTEIPLTHQRMAWWQSRMLHLIDHVNATWPGVPIWQRKLHRVGPVGGASYDWRHTGSGDTGAQEHFSNFFTDLRIHQIREMQDQVAIHAGVPSFDFGEIWEGWQSHQQMVHPLLYPGGPAFGQALIHHIWMESKGRETWALTKTRPLSPLWKPSTDAL